MAHISERKPDLTYYKKNYAEISDENDSRTENKKIYETGIKASLFSPNTNIKPSENVTFVAEIINCGKTIINNMHISLVLSETGFSYVEGSALYYSDNSMPSPAQKSDSDIIEFDIPTALSPGKSAWLSFLITANVLTPTTNSVYAYAVVDSETSTNTIRFTSEFALISAEKTSILSENGCHGKTIYTITLTNNGNIAACNIVLHDILTDGFKTAEIYYNGDLLTNGTDYTIDSDNRLMLTVPSCIMPQTHGVVQIVGSF